MTPKRTYTTQQVADMAGITHAAVLQFLIRWPKLKPAFVGNSYAWTEENVKAYLDLRKARGRGRPPKESAHASTR